MLEKFSSCRIFFFHILFLCCNHNFGRDFCSFFGTSRHPLWSGWVVGGCVLPHPKNTNITSRRNVEARTISVLKKKNIKNIIRIFLMAECRSIYNIYNSFRKKTQFLLAIQDVFYCKIMSTIFVNHNRNIQYIICLCKCSAGNSLIRSWLLRSSLMRSFTQIAHRSCAHSLRSLK